jgi:hypothetical protein
MPPKLSTGTRTILFHNRKQLPRRPHGVRQFDEESRRQPVWTGWNSMGIITLRTRNV